MHVHVHVLQLLTTPYDHKSLFAEYLPLPSSGGQYPLVLTHIGAVTIVFPDIDGGSSVEKPKSESFPVYLLSSNIFALQLQS